MEEKFSLKDHLFNPTKVAFLAQSITAVHPNFEHESFQNEVIKSFPQLELKERIAHIRQCFRKYLPSDYQEATRILLQALPAPLNETLSDNDFGDFIYAPFSDFVAHYGCTREQLHFSLEAIKEMTKRFSAEFSIRFFINAFPQETLAALLTWANDSNYHVRRLCSEGSRPKLPWAQKIHIAAEDALPILHRLFADKTRFVTRSVANHLNDIAKIHPELVLTTLKQWQTSGQQTEAEMNFMTKHSLRTLVKMGQPEALLMLGFGNSTHIDLNAIQFDTRVKVGDALSFSFELSSTETKTAVVDYILYFQNKQGVMSSKKIFKLQTLTLYPETPQTLSKRHVFRPNMTTRQLYAGIHQIDIQVNGTVLASFQFELEV